MECPECQLENKEGAKFCNECGHKLELVCPECGVGNQIGSKFCNECGYDITAAKEIMDKTPDEEIPSITPSDDDVCLDSGSIVGERKHVTVLFSDLTGYTSMSEKLDPEEVKEVTTQIFDKISKIISKYEGFIEKFAGDAVMVLFGATIAHEDDPVRAITAAREIHNLVNSLSPKYEERIEHPLSMHTGINTGLVVTGEVNLEKGIHGVAGDAINVAARLSDLGNAGDIIVASDTYFQAQGYFDFKELEPAVIKGKSEPIRIFKVLSVKDQPVKIHRFDGLRAELVGRKVEMNQLADAVNLLKHGRGSAISICGTAGTGKSRLVGDFKESLNLEEVQWLEGHAYPYSQNIPYHPLIDLLTKTLRIEESDPPEKIKEKVESGISTLSGEMGDVVPYVGSLFSLKYPEIENVSPEFWKTRLQKAVHTILSSLAQGAPTIICLEDLHWADPSFLELIRSLLSDSKEPILFLCIYRPLISLFTSHQIDTIVNPYLEIRLQDLSPSESQSMVESLLKSQKIPAELQRFIHEKVEGNPFYIEEVINSLIESKALVRDNGSWKTTKAISESDISTTIHGVISGRIDRLETKTKRIIQEASVIGRAFLYDILKKITKLDEHIDNDLSVLERLDLIRTRTVHPELEYIFKHALTQEVVYSGLLKKERKEIHENIAQVIELLFHDRLFEFYETLAFHYKQGRSLQKSIDYLVKSGEISLKRYAVEESHMYFKEAFELLSEKPGKMEKEKRLLVDLIIRWAPVFYYRGDFRGLINLYMTNEAMAKSVNDKKSLGMFNAWLGFAKLPAGDGKGSYNYLIEALQIGEDIRDQQLIAYACCWLSWTCGALGFFEEGIGYGDRAHTLSKMFESDHYLYFKTLGGIAFTYYYIGDCRRPVETGNALLEYSEKHSNIRSKVVGHLNIGMGDMGSGDYPAAIKHFKKAVHISQDPFYREYSRVFLGMGYLLHEQIHEAEEALQRVYDSSYEMGFEGSWGIISKALLGVVTVTKGELSRGIKALEKGSSKSKELEMLPYYAQFEYILGNIYLQIIKGNGQKSLPFLIKNIGFLVQRFPFAGQKAETHFLKAINIAEEIGAKGILGQAYRDLGILYLSKKRDEQAREYISKAYRLFEQCDAQLFLKQTKDILETL